MEVMKNICKEIVVELWANGFNDLVPVDKVIIMDHVSKCVQCKQRIENWLNLNPNKSLPILPLVESSQES